MKILFVVNNLQCGGAQKSLSSLLGSFPESDDLSIDLLVLNQDNMFFDQLPERVNFLPPIQQIQTMQQSIVQVLRSRSSLRTKWKALRVKSEMKMHYRVQYDTVQNLWLFWKDSIEPLSDHYDLAISYVDGFSNYFVMDKVLADRKILWVHNEYDKLPYSAEYDGPYFSNADAVVTISDVCCNNLQKNFPDIKDKFLMIPNLSSRRMLRQLAGDSVPLEYEGKKPVLVSIGRLNQQKGFDLAIEAAEFLKKEKIHFHWYIIGEGELKEELQKQINDKQLTEEVQLLGLRKNPYPYIRFADIFVQPSRYEGKSIVLDEAKILEKPIIITDYPSAPDSICNGKNGMIVRCESEEISRGIQKLLSDKQLCTQFRRNLANEIRNEDDEIARYMQLFFNKIQ